MRKVLVAVGIALLLSLVGVAINNAIAATNVQCKSATDTHNFGSFWPGDQYVTDHTHFCWGLQHLHDNVYQQVITSRSTSITAHGDQVGGLCDVTSKKSYLIDSGTNFREWEDDVVFKCATNIPGVFVTRDDKMDLWVDAEGQYCGPDYCPCAKNNNCGK